MFSLSGEKKQKHRTPRIKQSIQPKLISESSIPPPSANKVTRETYADQLRQNKSNESPPESSFSNALIVEIRDMMAMMKQLISQVTAMTNLVISLIPKPSNCP